MTTPALSPFFLRLVVRWKGHFMLRLLNPHALCMSHLPSSCIPGGSSGAAASHAVKSPYSSKNSVFVYRLPSVGSMRRSGWTRSAPCAAVPPGPVTHSALHFCVAGSIEITNSTGSPVRNERALRDGPWMAVECTYSCLEPSFGVMKPYPFTGLNHVHDPLCLSSSTQSSSFSQPSTSITHELTLS